LSGLASLSESESEFSEERRAFSVIAASCFPFIATDMPRPQTRSIELKCRVSSHSVMAEPSFAAWTAQRIREEILRPAFARATSDRNPRIAPAVFEPSR